ncbi:MAG: hypothetical protein IID13_05970 [Candidatus Marinimicrobia bacterium]|nr:hypothetical protein [Candidatus Neomarinimicrobiota bacterium]
MDGRFDSDTFPLMMRVILAILCLAAWAPSQTTRLLWNGYDWQRIDRLTAEYPEYRQPLKRAYVQGLLDAKLYYFLQSWAVDTADAGVRRRLKPVVTGGNQHHWQYDQKYLSHEYIVPMSFSLFKSCFQSQAA